MNSRHEGLWSIHAAVLIFGATALFARLIPLPADQITLLRSLFALIAVALWLGIRRVTIALPSRHELGLATLLGVLLAAHWVTYFHSMQIASIAVGVIALHTYPVITVFLEPLFHGERPHLTDILAALAIFLGILLLVPEFSLANATFQGVLIGVLSALLFSLRNILQRRYFAGHSPGVSLFYQLLVVILVLAPISSQNLEQIAPPSWLLLLILGILFTALPHILYVNSLRHLQAKTASLIGSSQVVYSTLFATLVLAEIPDWKTLLGGVIVIGAAVWETLKRPK